MSVYLKPSHLAQAERLVAGARANGGLAPLDMDRFWADQDKAIRDPWAKDCPQVSMGIMMGMEAVFDELGEKEDWRRLYQDPQYAVGLARRYNDKAEQIVGRRLLSEAVPDPARAWPCVKGLHDIFEAKNVWRNESWWMEQSANTPAELEALLDRVETRLANLRGFILPPNWAEEKSRLTAMGCKVELYRGQRGPVTFATSVYGVENLIFLIMDQPDLAGRFRDLILRAMLERARILDEEAGFSPHDAPRGFWFCDDNCAILNPDMYEFYGAPILDGIFARYAPDAGDPRFQHSDSDMGHLLPILGRLRLTGVNFGPNLSVSEIRRNLPNALIHGQLAPFTFSRNEEVNIVAEFLRDFEMARETRGLQFATAGSINNGSRLSGMRLIMAAIQECGRY